MQLIIATNLDLALWLALTAGMLLGLPYIALPLAIKKKFHSPTEPRVLPFDTVRNPPPTEAIRFFERVENELAVTGFEATGTFVTTNEFGNVTAFLMLSENRRTNDTALTVIAFGLPSPKSPNSGVITEKVLSFRRRFVDGTEVITSNTNVPRIFPKVERKRVFRFPQINNAQVLFEAHLCAVKEFATSSAVPFDPHQSPLERLMQDMRQEIADQAASGYLQLNEARDKYVATWKGAFFMTWPHLWPIKHWQRKSRHRRAAALLRKWNAQVSHAN